MDSVSIYIMGGILGQVSSCIMNLRLGIKDVIFFLKSLYDI